MSTLRFSRIVAFATLCAACSGGPSDPVDVIEPPPTTFVSTITYQVDKTSAPVPNSILRAECKTRNSRGESVQDTCTWKLDGVVIITSLTLVLEVSPGTYELCVLTEKVPKAKCIQVSVPPVVLSFTASILAVSTELTRITYPRSRIHAEGNGVDSRGNTVTDGFTWELDGAVIGSTRVVEHEAASGSHRICLSVENSEKACEDFVIPPAPSLHGVVYAVTPFGGEPSRDRTVCAKWAQDSSCVTTNPLGGYFIEDPILLGDSVMLSVECSNYPCDITEAVATLEKSNFSQVHNFSVPVKSWAIQSGRWAGISVELSLAKAYAKAKDGQLSFFTQSNLGNQVVYHLKNWDDLPISVVFDRLESTVPIDSNEQHLFISEINHDLGGEYFKVGTIGIDVVRKRWPDGSAYHEGGVGVICINSASHFTNLLSSVSSLNGGTIKLQCDTNSGVALRRRGTKHELLHMLGFSHNPRTSWFPGVMTDYQSPSEAGDLLGVVISEETAHIQMFYAIRKSQKLRGGYGIPQIAQGERMAQGLPRENIFENPFLLGTAVLVSK